VHDEKKDPFKAQAYQATSAQYKTCKRLEVLWNMVPQMRLGQFIACVIKSEGELFYIDNQKLLDKLEAYTKEAKH
jgi:hypothetical protein